jgi:hypothetical protein
MHVVMRSYSGQGGSDLLDLLEQREQEVRELITGVPGFIHYVAFRTDDGGCTVTVCEGKEGTDESSRRAADWVKENVTSSIDSPTISEGDAVLQF